MNSREQTGVQKEAATGCTTPPEIGGDPAAAQGHPPQIDALYVTAMSHFYRGEIGRIMAWRARLDNTTNWAITTSSTIITVAFSLEAVPHILFFFNIAIVGILLWIEARRYRFYDAFRARVRMLEAHFLVPIVARNDQLLQGDWQKLVCEDLLLPSFKIGRFEAIGRRLKRNYGYLYLTILSAWITKLFLHAKQPITDLPSFYAALQVGTSIPSWLVAFVLTGTFLFVISMLAYFGTRSSGEISEFGTHRALWHI